MNIRSRETTVTFRKPFRLSAIVHVQPAGTYRVVVDEEEIPAASFLTYRRIATTLHMPSLSSSGSSQIFTQVITASAGELASALEADIGA